jgi:hypothetical protein
LDTPSNSAQVTPMPPTSVAGSPGPSALPYPYRNGAADSTGMGFQVFSTVGANPTTQVAISSVTTSGSTVTIQLSSAPPTGAALRLAYGFEGERYAINPLIGMLGMSGTVCSWNYPTSGTGSDQCNGEGSAESAAQGILHGNIYTVPDYTDLYGAPIRHFMVSFNEPVLPQPGPAAISGGACAGCKF